MFPSTKSAAVIGSGLAITLAVAWTLDSANSAPVAAPPAPVVVTYTAAHVDPSTARLAVLRDSVAARTPSVASRAATRPPAPAKPTVRKTVTHKVTVQPVKKLYKKSAAWVAGNWSRFKAWVEQSALCVAHHESWSSGLWTARNRTSSASGFAQWIDSTWRVQAARAGVGTNYARAYLAPPEVQAAVFAYQALHHGLYPWHGTYCPGT